MRTIAFRCSYSDGNKHRQHAMTMQPLSDKYVYAISIWCGYCTKPYLSTNECRVEPDELVKKCRYHL